MVPLIGLAAIKIVTFLALVHRVVSMMKLNGIIHFAKKKKLYCVHITSYCQKSASITQTKHCSPTMMESCQKKVTFEHKEIFDDLTPSKRLLAVALHYTVLQSLISQERKI